MKKKENIEKLENFFSELAENHPNSVDGFLNQEGISPDHLVKNGLERIKVLQLKYKPTGKNVERALKEWNAISHSFNEEVNKQVEGLLQVVNEPRLQLFFQVMDSMDDLKELDQDLAKMEQEIRIYKLIEKMKKSQSKKK